MAKFPSSSVTMKDLYTLLTKSPEVAGNIHTLTYYITKSDTIAKKSWLPFMFTKTDFTTEPWYKAMFYSLSGLRALHISHFERHHDYSKTIDWMLPLPRKVLVPLLHLPTLTSISLAGVDNFPPADFAGCPNLKELEIDTFDCLPDNNGEFQEPLPANPVMLERFVVTNINSTTSHRMSLARRPDGRPIIDFSTLKSIVIAQQQLHDMMEIFGACKQLAEVDIHVNDETSSFNGLSTILKPSLHSLKHLKLEVLTGEHPDTEDPLAGLGHELEQMSGQNVIETIKLTVTISTDRDCKRGDEWGVLDRVLMSNPYQLWPALREFTLSIVVGQYYNPDGEELVDSLRKLPESQFRKLSTNEGVKFNFEVSVKYV